MTNTDTKVGMPGCEAAKILLNELPLDFKGMSEADIDRITKAINIAVVALDDHYWSTAASAIGAFSHNAMSAEEALRRIGNLYLKRKERMKAAGARVKF